MTPYAAICSRPFIIYWLYEGASGVKSSAPGSAPYRNHP